VTTLVTHPLPILALGLALGPRVIPPRLLLAGLFFACLPDADMLAFKLGIAYADAFGHRGFSHSLLFAALCATLGAAGCRLFGCGPLKAGLWILLATLSHSLLDALTDGGLGVAWLWPLSDQRHFLPWRPIEVSPFLHGFIVEGRLSERAWLVLASEARWIWGPCLALSLNGVLGRRLHAYLSARPAGSLSDRPPDPHGPA